MFDLLEKFDESRVARDSKGRFASKGGGGAAAAKPASSTKKPKAPAKPKAPKPKTPKAPKPKGTTGTASKPAKAPVNTAPNVANKKSPENQINQPKATREQAEALKKYQGTGYHSVNAGLRKPPPDAMASSMIQKIDSAIDVSKIAAPITTYRGISGTLKIGGRALKPGDVFRDGGFGSSSTDISVASKFASSGTIIHIDHQAGQRALSMNRAIGDKRAYSSENEILMPRNTTLRVDRIEVRKDKTTHIYTTRVGI